MASMTRSLAGSFRERKMAGVFNPSAAGRAVRRKLVLWCPCWGLAAYQSVFEQADPRLHARQPTVPPALLCASIRSPHTPASLAQSVQPNRRDGRRPRAAGPPV